MRRQATGDGRQATGNGRIVVFNARAPADQDPDIAGCLSPVACCLFPVRKRHPLPSSPFLRHNRAISTAADTISGGIQAELDAIAASVGAKAGDTADLKLKLKEKFDANVSGGLKINYQPPKCTVTKVVPASTSRRASNVDCPPVWRP